MSRTPEGNVPSAGSTYDIGWILVAGVLAFALFGLLGLGIVAAVALILAWISGFGGV